MKSPRVRIAVPGGHEFVPRATLNLAVGIADTEAVVLVRSFGRRIGFTAVFESYAPPVRSEKEGRALFLRAAQYLVDRHLGTRVNTNCVKVPMDVADRTWS